MNETEKNMNPTTEDVDKTVFPQYTQPYKEPESQNDSGSVFLGILSFLLFTADGRSDCVSCGEMCKSQTRKVCTDRSFGGNRHFRDYGYDLCRCYDRQYYISDQYGRRA